MQLKCSPTETGPHICLFTIDQRTSKDDWTLRIPHMPGGRFN